jgi:hypothetical protein
MILLPIRRPAQGRPSGPPLRGRASGAVLDQAARSEKLASKRSTPPPDRQPQLFHQPYSTLFMRVPDRPRLPRAHACTRPETAVPSHAVFLDGVKDRAEVGVTEGNGMVRSHVNSRICPSIEEGVRRDNG